MAGRPRFKPTDEERKQVEAMSGYGVPIESICALIRNGIDNDTLKKHFRSELDRGKAKANTQIGQTLFQKAIGGDTTAAIWWSKTQMQWRETKDDNALKAAQLIILQLDAELKRKQLENMTFDDSEPESKRVVFEVVDGRKNAPAD